MIELHRKLERLRSIQKHSSRRCTNMTRCIAVHPFRNSCSQSFDNCWVWENIAFAQETHRYRCHSSHFPMQKSRLVARHLIQNTLQQVWHLDARHRRCRDTLRGKSRLYNHSQSHNANPQIFLPRNSRFRRQGLRQYKWSYSHKRACRTMGPVDKKRHKNDCRYR
jgi:hypothetical protein